MVVGVPKEIKTDEFRVGLTPYNVAALVGEGHTVVVEKGAGEGSGFDDASYSEAGASLAENAAEVFEKAGLIVKVKEPQPTEYALLNASHTLFTYLHLAPCEELTTALMECGVTAIGYETVGTGGNLPLLKPMSEIAGKMGPLAGAHHLSRYAGGEGLLIGGAVGVLPANVLIVGAGNAGSSAAKIAVGMGADVTVVNRSTPKLEHLQQQFPSVKTAVYSPTHFLELLKQADLVISSVLIPGASAPHLIDRNMLRQMKPGSVIVDIAIDQGGTAETSRPTTHRDPTFVEEGVVHYCVANMPGAYPKTATTALTNATFPYVRKLANEGFEKAVVEDAQLAVGVNVFRGHVTNRDVAGSLGFKFTPLSALL